jgi:hypothetical protein
MIILLNLHSGTKLSGWLRHCPCFSFKAHLIHKRQWSFIYIFRACFSTSCRYSEVLIETLSDVSFDIFYICNFATKQ